MSKSETVGLNIDRNKPNIPVKSMSMGSIEKTYPTIATQSYYTVEIGYTASNFWSGLDGVMGMGYGVFNVTFKSLVEKVDPLTKQFAINFEEDDESGGNIYVGKDTIDNDLLKSHVVDSSDANIYWGEKQYRMSDYIWKTAKQSEANNYVYTYEHRLPIYDLQFVCSKQFVNSSQGPKSIFGNYSSGWQVSVTSRIDGITLPRPYYDAVMTWLLDYAATVGFENKTFSEWDEKLISSLPALSFVLHDGYDHPRFDIPLSALFDSHGLKIFKRREELFVYEGGVVTFDPTIEVGLKVWSRLFIPVFDMANYRVGLIKKASASSYRYNSTFCSGLSRQNTCIGAQHYYEPTNRCLDPQCSSYLFQFVNPDSKTCDLGLGFYFAIFAVVAVCVIADFSVFEFHLKMGDKLQQAALQRNSRLPPPTTSQQ